VIKRLLFGLFAMATLGASCDGVYTVPTAAQSAQGITAVGGKPVEMSAWLVFWDPLSVGSFDANVTRLNRVYVEAYACLPDGSAGHIGTFDALAMRHVVALAKAHGVKVLGTMNNYDHDSADFDRKRVEKFLGSPALMEAHVQGLLALAAADGLDGLDVDYESLDAQDRGGFSAFVARLCEAAHAKGLTVGLAAHPKVSEPGTWGGPQAQNYAVLGAAVDYFHVMTYDYHWATSGAGSLAPLSWVRQVAEFTASKVPPSKVELGVNTYGMAWQGKGQDLTWPGFLGLQSKLGRAYRDDDGYELRLDPPGGEVWMPDAETSLKKFQLAQELGLGAVALWVLGQEDPATWTTWDKFNRK
jgi:spore germination protein